MFTGIIEEMGVVKELDRGLRSARATILAKRVLDGFSVGDSITVDGVCLTAIACSDTDFRVDVSFETLDVTTLGAFKTGDAVNLERAMRLDSRVGGHLVSGHIDGVGVIRHRQQEENAILFSIEAPPHVIRYCIRKGSIAMDGISMTINEVTDKEFQVAVIPHTVEVTTLGLKGVGAAVNLECDLIGKYVERLLFHEGCGPDRKVTRDYLKRKGLL